MNSSINPFADIFNRESDECKLPRNGFSLQRLHCLSHIRDGNNFTNAGIGKISDIEGNEKIGCIISQPIPDQRQHQMHVTMNLTFAWKLKETSELCARCEKYQPNLRLFSRFMSFWMNVYELRRSTEKITAVGLVALLHLS